MPNRFTQWEYRCALRTDFPLRTFGFNDHLGVMKSVMGELTDSTNRAQGYSLMSIVWSFGGTVGFVTNFFNVLMQLFWLTRVGH